MDAPTLLLPADIRPYRKSERKRRSPSCRMDVHGPRSTSKVPLSPSRHHNRTALGSILVCFSLARVSLRNTAILRWLITVETPITHTVRWTIRAMAYQGLWVPGGRPKKVLKKSSKKEKFRDQIFIAPLSYYLYFIPIK
jgi:hypothetical protein